MLLKLKICGITRLEDARYCAAAGADYLGFVQHPESPRYIPAAAAREIIDWVYGPESVGVFVNRTSEEINAAVEEAGFSLAQLHGEESPEVCSSIDVPVIKAIRVAPFTGPVELSDEIERFRDVAQAILLDTRAEDVWGGSGKTFDWKTAADLPDNIPIFIAGGIGVNNLKAAVDRVRPAGIDVSSSLESAPGMKDFELVDAFIDVFRHVSRRRNGSFAS